MRYQNFFKNIFHIKNLNLRSNKINIWNKILNFIQRFVNIPLCVTNPPSDWEHIFRFNDNHPECKLNNFIGYPGCGIHCTNYLAIGENEDHDIQIQKYKRFLEITKYNNEIEPKWYKLKYTFVYD